MKGKGRELLLALVLGVLCPAMIFQALEKRQSKDTAKTTEQAVHSETFAATEAAQPNHTLTVAVQMPDGTITRQDLEEYITSVVLREMPAEFEPEALKAQAVVARTYTLRHRSNSKHPGADICTDPSCCQGYRSPWEFLQEGGREESLQKVSEAVESTRGQVLTYNGNLIEATYFSCSGGKTEDAQAVWGADYPYLQSVSSPGEESATHYTDTVTFTTLEFQNKLGAKLSGSSEKWISSVTYTEGGGVASMKIGDKSYTGVQLRQLLDLRSTSMAITVLGNTVTVTTKGFGHRVGMSQYGADAMAVSGSTYDKILIHYYQNTVLDHWWDVD